MLGSSSVPSSTTSSVPSSTTSSDSSSVSSSASSPVSSSNSSSISSTIIVSLSLSSITRLSSFFTSHAVKDKSIPKVKIQNIFLFFIYIISFHLILLKIYFQKMNKCINYDFE